jgi:hypothetical protein
MMNESIKPMCCSDPAVGCGMNGLEFEVISMQRLENATVFRRFKKVSYARSNGGVTISPAPSVAALPRPTPPQYEADLCEQRDVLFPNAPRPIHSWLKKLGIKNELSAAANSVYLLHGTSSTNLASISKEGLSTRRAKRGHYGKGVYFTDSSCKASQYGDVILICRVALGDLLVVPEMDTSRIALPARARPDRRGDSIMAASGRTRTSPTHAHPFQVHNEYVVFGDAAIYPEFALKVRKVRAVPEQGRGGEGRTFKRGGAGF